MGRMSRQRRYKSCDPFTIQRKKEVNKFDNPPKKSELKFDQVFNSKKFERNQAIIDRASAKKKKDKVQVENDNTQSVKKLLKSNQPVKSDAIKNGIPVMKPNETKKQYFQRLDENIKEAISKTMMETKTLRKKRKLHLKARDEKIKEKKKKVDQSVEIKDFSSFKDEIKFGEVAERPPTLSAVPRGASKDKKLNNLKLTSLLDDKSDVKCVKKRKEMTFVEQQKFDNDRQKAIDAYRMIKKQKMKV